jgi:hypothetical protein
MHRRQVLVPIAEVILAELTRDVSGWFEQVGDRRILAARPPRPRPAPAGRFDSGAR